MSFSVWIGIQSKVVIYERDQLAQLNILLLNTQDFFVILEGGSPNESRKINPSPPWTINTSEVTQCFDTGSIKYIPRFQKATECR